MRVFRRVNRYREEGKKKEEEEEERQNFISISKRR